MTYEQYLSGEPLIITVALTGGVHGKEANPNLPETPEEIAEAAANVEEAGAAMVHLHARRPNGERSYDRERFQELTEAVRSATDDLIVQHSTGGTRVPLEKRRVGLRTDPPPDMASLDMGPLNRYRHLTSKNTRAMIDSFAEEMRDRGIKPELEVFNNGHLNEVYQLLDRIDPERPLFATLIFGGGTTSPPSPRNLLSMIDNLPDDALFNTLGFAQHQLPLTTMGIICGGHVRVGLEDNVHYEKGRLADSNRELVERTIRIAHELNREVATPSEARSILGLS